MGNCTCSNYYNNIPSQKCININELSNEDVLNIYKYHENKNNSFRYYFSYAFTALSTFLT